MKKRIVCVLLTLILLMSLVPVTASAASMAVSEKGITVLKQLQKYSATCKQVGTEWRNGYGTICTKSGDHTTHTIKETDADKALRTKLKELDTAVNSFASSTGVTLNQNQFDALVLFSYDAGTAWMNGTGILRSAILNKAGAGEIINAMVSYDDGTNEVSLESSRRVIANMYINGAYSNVPPTNYRKVTYKVKQSEAMLAQGILGSDGYLTYSTYFDASAKAQHQAVPTSAGKTFLGWYTSEGADGKWLPNLNSDCADTTLYAKWQKNGLKPDAGVSEFAAVNYTLTKASLASTTIFSIPDVKTGKEVGKVTADTVTVSRDYLGADGSRWSMIGSGQWVVVNAGSNGLPSGTDIDVTVTVTNSFVNSRVNATIHCATNGSYKKGDQLRIINTESADGFLWGQVAKSAEDNTPIGWVALMYTNWNSVKDNTSNTGSANNTKAIATAIVSCNGFLNVRKAAGTDNAIVGALANGDCVDIFEISFVNGHKWGRTSQGWILLTYAKVTMLNNNVDYSNSTDVLAYTFTGKLNKAVTARTDISDSADTVGKELAAGTVVAMSMVKNDGLGNIWGFNGTGWIKLSDVTMDVAKYVVVADAVTVREDANTSSAQKEKVTKGVELDISEIKVVDATIWGKTEKYGGWVNLASKYVTRSNAPTIENVEGDKETGLIATVINTGSVRVRNYGSVTSGKVIGSLAGGTTVKVWESNEDGDWYKIDTNQNGVYDYEEDGWVSAKYLDVYKGTIGGSTGNSSGSNGSTNTNAPVETGLGIVANTYSGVNIRQGAGIGYNSVGKYLNGTSVEILEVKSTATSKWGRTNKGWICMDYVTMISKYPIGGTATDDTNSNAGQNAGGSTTESEGNTTISRTPAVYSASAKNNDIAIQKTADEDALTVRTLSAGDSVTIQELAKVVTKKTVTEGEIVDGSGKTETSTVETTTTYWARTSEGWIEDPAANLSLRTLDEITYTVYNNDNVNVMTDPGSNTLATSDGLKKGTQVVVTELEIVGDKVWGMVENIGTSGGWVRLDQLSEGALTIKSETAPTTPAATTPTLGSTGNTSTGGYVNNGGYKYTGKVINTKELNVRSSASTGSSVTTTLKGGAALVIYETTIAENMAWGRCDAGWVYLYYVDLTPCVNGAVDARVVFNDNTIIYSDVNGSSVVGTYAKMSVVDIYEIVGKMARTDQGWINTDNLL